MRKFKRAMKKKNIKTIRGGREHDEEAEHDVSEADVADELGHKRLTSSYAGQAGRTKRKMKSKRKNREVKK